MIIETPDDWWCALDAHWQNILDIFGAVGAPLSRTEDGHWWSDDQGKEPSRHDKPLVRVLEEARENRDHETLSDFLQKAWSAAPDSERIHSWPSWHVLCDLCSEGWVFHADAEAAQHNEVPAF